MGTRLKDQGTRNVKLPFSVSPLNDKYWGALANLGLIQVEKFTSYPVNSKNYGKV
jgi:hypothetical protein